MTSKFEQLIEYVINDEEAKAKELFHDIVVEKSREIYENLMDESEELEEEAVEEGEEIAEESTHDEDEKAEKAGEKVTKDIEYDDKKDRMDEEEANELMEMSPWLKAWEEKDGAEIWLHDVTYAGPDHVDD